VLIVRRYDSGARASFKPKDIIIYRIGN
jgi:hypothetical protein